MCEAMEAHGFCVLYHWLIGSPHFSQFAFLLPFAFRGGCHHSCSNVVPYKCLQFILCVYLLNFASMNSGSDCGSGSSPMRLGGVPHWSWQLVPKGLLDKVKVRPKDSLEYRLTFTPWHHLVGSYHDSTRGHQESGSSDSTSTPWWRLKLCMLVVLPHTHSSSDGAKR